MLVNIPLRWHIISVVLGLILVGCAYQSGLERSAIIQNQAEQGGWQNRVIHTPQFDLQSFGNGKAVIDGQLTIYLEGDGFAWVDGQYPSEDPTPFIPLALHLAMAQPGSGAVAYLGRPCQYRGAQTDPRCHKAVWTDARFSENVVNSMDAAISQLKQLGVKKITLVGYSGGAAIALLVAARRSDIARIITVAGNLDPQSWTTYLRLQPLNGLLETATLVKQTAAIPRVDFVGGKDQVVPPILTELFAKQYPVDKQPHIITIPENTHSCCWAQQWKTLWMKAQSNHAL
ncbi:alpha/beta hydrolase [Polynucleobacter sp. HIN6]|uniref:alpha/beta hydrolase n=1 Tax=Polynucleobacter sp. HIN6 TaxID=3047865 RepID=UPI002572741A|nr:alpha/beta hydrolase [Polynucleobacter sp. HIN6]